MALPMGTSTHNGFSKCPQAMFRRIPRLRPDAINTVETPGNQLTFLGANHVQPEQPGDGGLEPDTGRTGCMGTMSERGGLCNSSGKVSRSVSVLGGLALAEGASAIRPVSGSESTVAGGAL